MTYYNTDIARQIELGHVNLHDEHSLAVYETMLTGLRRTLRAEEQRAAKHHYQFPPLKTKLGNP